MTTPSIKPMPEESWAARLPDSAIYDAHEHAPIGATKYTRSDLATRPVEVTVDFLMKEDNEYIPLEGWRGFDLSDANWNIRQALTAIMKKYPNGIIITNNKEGVR